MNNVIQEVEWHRNYADIKTIYEEIQNRIDEGWRVHTFLERKCDVLIIYEKDK